MEIAELIDRYSFYIERITDAIEREKYYTGLNWKPGTLSDNLEELKAVYTILLQKVLDDLEDYDELDDMVCYETIPGTNVIKVDFKG